MLYDSLHGKLAPLPDDTLVYPAHGAGSLCGKNLSSETVSTIGIQRAYNYALAADDPRAIHRDRDQRPAGRPRLLHLRRGAQRARAPHAGPGARARADAAGTRAGARAGVRRGAAARHPRAGEVRGRAPEGERQRRPERELRHLVRHAARSPARNRAGRRARARGRGGHPAWADRVRHRGRLPGRRDAVAGRRTRSGGTHRADHRSVAGRAAGRGRSADAGRRARAERVGGGAHRRRGQPTAVPASRADVDAAARSLDRRALRERLPLGDRREPAAARRLRVRLGPRRRPAGVGGGRGEPAGP